jgi:hypothetical protein
MMLGFDEVDVVACLLYHKKTTKFCSSINFSKRFVNLDNVCGWSSHVSRFLCYALVCFYFCETF